DGNRAVSALPFGADSLGYVLDIDREEPANPRMFVLKVTRRPRIARKMDTVFLQVAENVVQHIEEVDANIGRNAAGLLQVSLPALEVPPPTRGDVSEVDLGFVLAGVRLDLFTQRHDRRMQAQLQYRTDLHSGVPFDLEQAIYVPGVEHERLFADGVRPGTKRKAHMRIVQVV